MLLLISPEQNFEEFFCLSHLGWSLWRSPLFLITCLSPRPLPPTIHAFPSSPHKTKAGSWKRSEVGKCIQWHRPDDSILRRPCNICFQPCLRAGTPCWAFCPTCSPHRAAVNGGLVQGHWSRNFSQPEQGGWAMRGVLRKTEKKSLPGHLRGCHGKTARQLSENPLKGSGAGKERTLGSPPFSFPFSLPSSVLPVVTSGLSGIWGF